MVKTSTMFLFMQIIIIFLGFSVLVYMHEKVHQTIFTNYGIDSKIELQFPDVATVPDNNSTGECNDYCMLAHHENEIVGYHLIAFYIFFSLTSFIIICIILK